MEKKLKVGYFVKMYPRLSETFIVNEILELERRGVEIVIFSLKKPNEGRFHPQVSQVKASVVYLDSRDLKAGWPLLHKCWPTLAPHKSRLWELFEELLAQDKTFSFELFFAAVSASAMVLDLGLDHLHGHFASTPSTVAYYASRITGVGYSFTAHAKGIFRNTIDAGLLEEKIKAARFVSTVTQFNKRHILSKFPSVPPDKISLVYNGIDLGLFRFDGDSPREAGLILAVGRLVPKKGFADLIVACSILKQKGVPFRCVIIGDGEQHNTLESLIQEFDLAESIVLLGPRTQSEVREYLERASVFALPCTLDSDGNMDALPTVLLEALASGCPIVSTTISGVPEIVDTGIDGLLVTPGDPTAMAGGIEMVLTNPALAARLALQGRQKAERKFDLKKNAAILENLFEETALNGATQHDTMVASVGNGSNREDTLSFV